MQLVEQPHMSSPLGGLQTGFLSTTDVTNINHHNFITKLKMQPESVI